MHLREKEECCSLPFLVFASKEPLCVIPEKSRKIYVLNSALLLCRQLSQKFLATAIDPEMQAFVYCIKI